LVLVSIGTGKFVGAWTAPELAGKATAIAGLEFEIGSSAASMVATTGTAVVALEMEIAVGPG